MSVAFVLSLAACSAQSIHPQQPPDLVPVRAEAAKPIAVPVPAAPPIAEPQPAPEPIVEAPQPAPEPIVEAPQPAISPTPVPLMKKKCNPMSRAGCRWEEARDERDTPRITKRPVPPETR